MPAIKKRNFLFVGNSGFYSIGKDLSRENVILFYCSGVSAAAFFVFFTAAAGTRVIGIDFGSLNHSC